ncbi:helix-turn-helix transcriptional regulator [Enterococcus casseliflavus]|uniref:helix-turn-helix transcriptional regulator n=1 Tax=Enterococcus casseliflavus TaxID=37734 RepID=UPI001E500771|nr:helix-turn-helix transcriptional regulator [Enterococcus casseliflavus]MCD5162455.1 helix-turn-helix transcriptional regulator [Enterococcus casseliflavus]
MEQYISHLKKYRQLANFTQEELANKVGVRRETIIRLESAKYNPSLKLAVDISRVVDAPVEDIFEFQK